MHDTAYGWVAHLRRTYPSWLTGCNVLEIGSRNINGSVRDLFTLCDYTGLSLLPQDHAQAPQAAEVDVPERTAWYMAKETVRKNVATTAHPDFGDQTYEGRVHRRAGGTYMATGWVDVDTPAGTRERRRFGVIVTYDTAKEQWQTAGVTWVD